MCGIIGYVGHQKAKKILINGLERLEYRGYDSAGLAVIQDNNSMLYLKSIGNVSQLKQKIDAYLEDGSIGIAHTRWATHGVPSENNCHPHTDQSKVIFVVHNGIIENYRQLRQMLQQKGITFRSDTDTEVIPHLIHQFQNEGLSLYEAFQQTLGLLTGTYAIAAISKNDSDTLLVCRKGSPLIIGLAQDGYIVASDVSPLIGYTNKVIYLKDGEIASIQKDSLTIKDLSGQIQNSEIVVIQEDTTAVTKDNFDHYMLKEIMEQPVILHRILQSHVDQKQQIVFPELTLLQDRLLASNRIIIISCGSSYYSALMGQAMLEKYVGIPVQAELASEFRYKNRLLDDKTLVIAISQSGETADTLEAMKQAKDQGCLVIGIINVVGSSMSRLAEASIYTQAGSEIGVASTKAFTAQIAILLLVSQYVGLQRQTGQSEKVSGILDEFRRVIQIMPEVIKKIQDQTIQLAQKYKEASHFLYLGRQLHYPLAFEGALKLKEISYIHAEGYASGEMKHGPIALIDKALPTLILIPQDDIYEKNVSTIQEIKARTGPVIAIATDGDSSISSQVDEVIFIPKTLDLLQPLISIVPLQLFAYYMAIARNNDPDKPRNLAKSVTVE